MESTHKKSININQFCYCQKSLSKHTINGEWNCNYCWKSYQKNVKTYYECGDGKCKWYGISSCYTVCEECYNSLDDDINGDDIKYSDLNDNKFIEYKIKANLNTIRKQIKQYENTDEKKK
eukprot:24004_1